MSEHSPTWVVDAPPEIERMVRLRMLAVNERESTREVAVLEREDGSVRVFVRPPGHPARYTVEQLLPGDPVTLYEGDNALQAFWTVRLLNDTAADDPSDPPLDEVRALWRAAMGSRCGIAPLRGGLQPFASTLRKIAESYLRAKGT